MDSIDLDGNGLGDIVQSNLEQIASDNCGTNTSTGQISYTSFSEGKGFSKGSYVFLVTADPLITGEKITRTAFPFIIPYNK